MEPTNDKNALETTLSDGRKVTLSLGPTDAPWAEGGVAALRPVAPTHTTSADNPPPLPEEPAVPLNVAIMGLVV
ncbi:MULTISPECIES: hypothetical protein [Streptomyces]|uniref:Uncharacterized protein n=1 Tax=Streptomyces tsukubensis (strain DSM 42081 / NBRC 108919 / NRRL 18488 / 9993) TaxID=1114943 RepID=I2N7P9_STRT9|nr:MULTISPECIES: hypothetical protein [Streptomyces]AZK96978.1 hypothetical protein B7R87_26230 [Streptomyces tsukubensis]EIF93046.1 hypothetical protein [Streptomyces tsukubensis NRRL18488]MYS66427.1 hypothetical protein [Streptomyces sp. SID5473]QKM67042.1 hypothetical protein STSU_007550 [Streptomyces tsukubensis NRRL18488]TAI41478.1 hypothetical protein EWI31_26905 [Streptomyces tsukubensis]